MLHRSVSDKSTGDHRGSVVDKCTWFYSIKWSKSNGRVPSSVGTRAPSANEWSQGLCHHPRQGLTSALSVPQQLPSSSCASSSRYASLHLSTLHHGFWLRFERRYVILCPAAVPSARLSPELAVNPSAARSRPITVLTRIEHHTDFHLASFQARPAAFHSGKKSSPATCSAPRPRTPKARPNASFRLKTTTSAFTTRRRYAVRALVSWTLLHHDLSSSFHSGPSHFQDRPRDANVA